MVFSLSPSLSLSLSLSLWVGQQQQESFHIGIRAANMVRGESCLIEQENQINIDFPTFLLDFF
jgi:hypothetical protein